MGRNGQIYMVRWKRPRHDEHGKRVGNRKVTEIL